MAKKIIAVKAILLASLFITSVPICASATESGGNTAPANYVGLEYGELPTGLEMLSGYLIAEGGPDEYIVEWIEGKGSQMLWLEKILRRPNEKSHYLVLDVLPLPELKNNERLVLGNCIEGNVENGGDGKTIAIAEETEGEIFSTITHAWKVDVQNQRFVQIPGQNVQCINEGFGE